MRQLTHSVLIQEARSLFLLRLLHLNIELKECCLQNVLKKIRTAINRVQSQFMTLDLEYPVIFKCITISLAGLIDFRRVCTQRKSRRQAFKECTQTIEKRGTQFSEISGRELDRLERNKATDTPQQQETTDMSPPDNG